VTSPSSALDEFVADAVESGDRVLARTHNRAVLTTGKPVHHLRHLIASIFCFLWVPAWAWIWLTGGEQTLTATVDADGQLSTRLSPMSLARKAFIAALVVGWLVLVAFLLVLLVWFLRQGRLW
jgi:hypothetical protein